MDATWLVAIGRRCKDGLKKLKDFLDQRVPFTDHVEVADRQPNVKWTKIMIAFCLVSALEITLLSYQTHSQLTTPFQLVSLANLFAFASCFVARFLSPRFENAAKVLEEFGVFSAATAFFLCTTIALPLSLKCIAGALYTICLLTILICKLWNKYREPRDEIRV